MTIPGFDLGDHAQPATFGPGSVAKLSEIVTGLGRTRPLVVCSWRRRRSEDFSQVARGLGTPSPPAQPVFAGAEEHVPRSAVDAAWAAVESNEADAVVSFGGGASIDLCKALVDVAAFGWEAFEARAEVPARDAAAKPLVHVAVPTTYSGAEATRGFGVSERGEKAGRGGEATRPDQVVADPVLTLSLPVRPTAATGMNALAHCVEALYSPTRTDRSDRLAEQAAAVLFRSLPPAVRDPGGLAARTDLLAAAYVAGVVLDAAGMGLHHGLCHGLGGRTGIAHGVANAIVLPHVMRFNLEATREAQERFALAIGAASAEDAADRVQRLVSDLGLPTRLREAGVFEQDLEPIAAAAVERSPHVKRNPRPVSEDDALAVLRAAW